MGSDRIRRRDCFHFSADHEPVAWVTAVAAIAFCLAAFLLRRQKIFPIRGVDRRHGGGFAVATWKTARVAHGVLARPMYSVQLSGFVETRDIRERTDRLSCGSRRWKARAADQAGTRSPVGTERHRARGRRFCRIEGAPATAARAPLRPGSYDFGRDMYFAGIGASGFVTGVIKTVEPPVAGGLSLRYAAFMQGLRDAIDARIRNVLDGDRRAIATALLTGRRDAISTPVNDAMFISGLGHVLSISDTTWRWSPAWCSSRSARSWR
jgi:competence protein ComEC